MQKREEEAVGNLLANEDEREHSDKIGNSRHHGEQKKKLKDQKKNQQAQKVKEIKFRLNIAEHDYAHKIEQGIEFLDDGCKLKVTITFKGREMARTEIGFDLANRITEDLSENGTIESPAKLLGKNINMTFNPKGSH